MVLNKLIQEALHDTLKLHKTQLRKGTDIPYASHPITLAMLLIESGLEEKIIVAALLHDTIEDTDMTIHQLKTKYGEEITNMVLNCTEPDQSLKWEIRKQNTIEQFGEKPDDVKWVIIADKLHNLYSLKHQHDDMGDSLWQYFSRGYEQQKWYYSSLLNLFEQEEIFKNHALFKLYLELYIELFKGSDA